MSNDIEDFLEYNHDFRWVKQGKHMHRSIGIGKVLISTIVGDGEKRLIKLNNVLYVPTLDKKFVSVSKCQENSKKVVFTKKDTKNLALVVDSNNRILMQAPLIKSLYPVEINEEENNYIKDQGDRLELWHRRFGHINKQTIINTAGAVLGMTGLNGIIIKDGSEGDKISCLPCAMGKQTRSKIPSSSRERAKEIGEYIHMDICGPIGEATLNGGKYFFLLKDEYSNFRFVYIMKSRDEAFECLKKTVARIMAETKKNIRFIVSDNGSEFTSKRSQDLFLENKIKHVTSAPFLPAQNGLIERDNRTIMNGVRAMLNVKKVPQRLWGEALVTFV